MIQRLRSFFFLAGMMVLIILGTVFLFLTLWFPKWFNAVQDWWGNTGMAWLRLTCNLDYQLEGEMPKGAYVIFSKHQSAWEAVALHAIFEHPLSWVLKKGLLWVPVFGWSIAMTKPIAIDRSSGRKAVEQVKQIGKTRLDEGCKVVIFPEGTRIPVGKMGRFKMGGSILAEYAGYPVVPVAHNAGEFWPRREFTKKPGVVQVRIGTPIETTGKTAEQINTEAFAWMEQAMAEISTITG